MLNVNYIPSIPVSSIAQLVEQRFRILNMRHKGHPGSCMDVCIYERTLISESSVFSMSTYMPINDLSIDHCSFSDFAVLYA